MRNRARKTRMKTAIKAVYSAIEANSVDQAQEALRTAIKVIDRTAARGVLHKRTAARKVSRLSKRVHAFAAAAGAEA